MDSTAAAEKITAPKIGFMPISNPNAIPASAECDAASPTALSLLRTILSPMHGAVNAISTAARKARCINSYENILFMMMLSLSCKNSVNLVHG